MKPRVFVTRNLPPAALDILAAECQVEVNRRDRILAPAQLVAKVRGVEGLVCLLVDPIDATVLGSAPGLKIVSNVAVGYDNIDVTAATRRKILVTNTPGVLDNTTADFAFTLLLAAARRVVEADAYLRAGRWREWGLMLFTGQDIHGKTLGICGLGRIGRAVARRARGFEMRILYTDAVRADEATERELGVTFVDKPTLLSESDFVTLHVPLLPETRHYLSTAEFRQMKRTAILVNASRGPVVDERALVRALRGGLIAGAGLDVYEREPRVERGLLGLKNVTLAPHIASASVATRTRMATMAAENCVAGLRGRRPPNLVNPEALG
jgi:glyoxylate reductase